jgi:hypothetical protein
MSYFQKLTRKNCCNQGATFFFVLLISIFPFVRGGYLNGSNIMVGVVSTGEFSAASLKQDWGPTFEAFLSESVGRLLSPPRNFSVVLMTIPMTFAMVEDKSIDLIFSTPSVFSCLETENSGTQMKNVSCVMTFIEFFNSVYSFVEHCGSSTMHLTLLGQYPPLLPCATWSVTPSQVPSAASSSLGLTTRTFTQSTT